MREWSAGDGVGICWKPSLATRSRFNLILWLLKLKRYQKNIRGRIRVNCEIQLDLFVLGNRFCWKQQWWHIWPSSDKEETKFLGRRNKGFTWHRSFERQLHFLRYLLIALAFRLWQLVPHFAHMSKTFHSPAASLELLNVSLFLHGATNRQKSNQMQLIGVINNRSLFSCCLNSQ